MPNARQRAPTEQETIMHEAGFVTASEAARAIGAGNVGTVHRAVKAKKLQGQRLGFYWFVKGESLLEAYLGTPIEPRVRALLDELGIKVKKGGRRVASA